MSTIRLGAPRPSKAAPGAVHPGKTLVTIIAIDDILSYPERLPKSVELSGDYQMKAGCRMYKFYATSSKQDASMESSGEEDAAVITHKFIAEHPGDDIDSQNFAQEWMGVPCIIIRDFCDGSLPMHFGSECAPLQLQTNFIYNAEKTAATFTFQAFVPTPMLPGRGNYNFIESDPFVVADNTAIALSAENGTHYQLASDDVGGSIAVATNTLAHNSLVTLIGAGGDDPSVLEPSANVVLNAGANWTALAGARITFRVYDGGASKYLIEQTRS